MLTDLPEAWIQSREGPDSWSPIEVVGHMTYLEETDWPARAQIILDQGTHRQFEPVDRFRHLEKYREKSLVELLDRFEALRRQNLRAVEDEGLSPEDLALDAEHPTLGTVTLQQLLSTWVVHDLTHIYQIVRTMAGRYRDDVGPWVEHLSVLTR